MVLALASPFRSATDDPVTQPYSEFFQGVVEPPIPGPFGALWDGVGTTFRVWSLNATSLELSLRAADGTESRVPMATEAPGIWSVAVVGAGPGSRYGFRADGPFLPAAGHVYNPPKRLLDPWARLIDGPTRWDDHMLGCRLAPDGALVPDALDTADTLPWCVVGGPDTFDWRGDRPPGVRHPGS